MKVAKEGLTFILPFIGLGVLFLAFGAWFLFGACLILASIFCFFFRDPKRHAPQDENSIIAPADGKVIKIQHIESHPSFPSSVKIVSIFLSIFDVHITRSSIAGVVEGLEYNPGQFFHAYRDEAGMKNQSNSIFIQGDKTNLLIKQIVGFAARRIKCFVKKNERVEKGQKLGLMYFGSRVDLFLGDDICLKIQLNQKVRAGETKIGEVKNENKQKARRNLFAAESPNSY